MQGVVVTAKVHTHGERLDVCLQEWIGSEGGEIQGAAALSTSFQGRLTLPGISPRLCSLLPAATPSVRSRLLLLLHSSLPWPITAFSNLMTHSTCLRPGLRHPLAQGNMRGNLMGSDHLFLPGQSEQPHGGSCAWVNACFQACRFPPKREVNRVTWLKADPLRSRSF